MIVTCLDFCPIAVDSGGANLPYQAEVFPDEMHFDRARNVVWDLTLALSCVCDLAILVI